MDIIENHINVVVVNGSAGAGKSTFEEMCSFILGPYYRSRSSIDKVKEIAKNCGWDGSKDLVNRKFLSDLKDLLTNFNDLPYQDMKKEILSFENELLSYNINPKKAFIFCDIREPQEIQRMKDDFNAITLLVRRDAAESAPTSNHADANVLNYNYDYIVDNNGTYEELRIEASKFINKFREK